MGVLFQIIYTGIICSLRVNLGLALAWPASTITLFASENTTLNRPMTETEISLLGSLSSIGALISTLGAGLLLDKLGRKNCCLITALTLVIFWALLAVSRIVEIALASVFLSGISSCNFLIASVYISEICQESIRGSMTAFGVVSFCIGTLLSYALGGYLPYDKMVYVGLILSVAGAVALIFLKDSPTWLMKTGNEKAALEAIAFFRHLKPSDKAVTEEINAIKSSLNLELEDLAPEEERLKPEVQPAQKLSFWQFMKKSSSTRRAFIVNMIIVTASIFQGFVVIQMYVKPLFKEAMPSSSATLCSMLMAAIVLIAGVTAAYLTDVAGRRPLMIYASFAAGVSCIILGTQIQLQWGPSWIAVVVLIVFSVMYTVGGGTVPYVLLADLFLPEVKSIISMLIVEWSWFCSFIILFIFNPLVNALGWGPVFYIFALCCFFTSIFCVFFLPETKGLPVAEVQLLFMKKKYRHSTSRGKV